MNCPRCGNPLAPNATTCGRCGLARPMPPGAAGSPADIIAEAQRQYNARMAQLTPAQRAYVEANMGAAGVGNPFERATGSRSPSSARASAVTCPKYQYPIPPGARLCSGCGAPAG